MTGILVYCGQQVAMGTMGYKQNNLLATKADIDTVTKRLSETQTNLKIIPCVSGAPVIAQLVAYNLRDVKLKGAWSGPARLHLVPHVRGKPGSACISWQISFFPMGALCTTIYR